ncbi:MAG: hypothetical protein ABUL54_05875, partial [Dongia sp.]
MVAPVASTCVTAFLAALELSLTCRLISEIDADNSSDADATVVTLAEASVVAAETAPAWRVDCSATAAIDCAFASSSTAEADTAWTTPFTEDSKESARSSMPRRRAAIASFSAASV